MKNFVLITSALLLTSLATAQQGGNTGSNSQRQMTPEMRARFAQMQPIMDLSQNIRLLPDLEKNKATAMTKAQAKQLLPILTALQKAQGIQPNDAKKFLSQIEDKIMTDKQLTAMDDLQLKADQERAARRAQAQRSGQSGQTRIPGMPPGVGGALGGNRTGQSGNATQGQNGGRGQFQPGQFNPFKQGRGADALKAYIAVLQKK